MARRHIFKDSKFFLVTIISCLYLQLTKEVYSADQPTLEIIPTPPVKQYEGELIYMSNRQYNASVWSDRIAEILKDYYQPQQQNLWQCSNDNQPPKPKGFICAIDMKDFGDCSKEFSFGYDRYMPCVFLKINPTPGWVPEFYNSTNELPQDMPNEIRTQISDAIATQQISKLNTLWVSCDGEMPVDRELIGSVQLLPLRGFPGYYFPMEGPNYMSPLVALRLLRPMKGIIIRIECRLWAKNIQYDRNKQLGCKIFELLLD